MITYKKLYLAHHGIKGQQWGVRNGPPYPIEDKVLKKGTRLNSVSGDYKKAEKYRKTGRPMYTYRDDEEWDNKVYKGPFSKYLRMYRGKRFVYEHKYETTKDLLMPTKKERIDEFKSIYSDPNMKDTMVKEMLGVQKLMKQYGIASSKKVIPKIYDIDLNNLKTNEDFKLAYEIFGHNMEEAYNYKSTSEYMKRMASKFDAMVDDNNQGQYNNAHDPIIIFKADKFLKTVGKSTKVKDLEIRDNTDSARAELNKIGHILKY